MDYRDLTDAQLEYALDFIRETHPAGAYLMALRPQYLLDEIFLFQLERQ
jgi:hypothetical protein